MSRIEPKYRTAWVAVDGASLVVSEDRKTSRKPLPSAADAEAEAQKFIARREKAGWRVTYSPDSPWIPWIFELERMWGRVIADARASGVGVGEQGATIPGHMWSQFHHGFSPSSESRIASPEYAGLDRIGAPSLALVLGDANLCFDISFEIGAQSTWGFPGDLSSCIWRRYELCKFSGQAGVLNGDVLGSRLEDEVIRHESAEAFRRWFLKHIRDDVMGFVIAELAR